jgi:hypothetical protein
VRRIRWPSGLWSGHSRAAAERLTMTLVFGDTASSFVNVRPCSSAMPIARK